LRLAKWVWIAGALACGCVPVVPLPAEPGVLVCRGSFGAFAKNRLVATPSQLNFVIDWAAPYIATDTGRPGVIVVLNPYEIVFDIRYDDYLARYRINRLDGSIQQTTPLGGLFVGRCTLSPVQFRF
jgi:hypothetical protein